MQRDLPGMWGTGKGVLEPKAGLPNPFSSSQRLRADPVPSSSLELPGDSADGDTSSSSSVPAPRRPLSCSSFHLSSPGYSPDLAPSPVQVGAAGGGSTILN